MSILAKIKSWFFGVTTKEEDNALDAPYKMEPPTMDPLVTEIMTATPDWPFPRTRPEVVGVAKVAEAKPARKPRAPAKLKASPKAEAKPKAVKAKPATKTAKPKAAPKTKTVKKQ